MYKTSSKKLILEFSYIVIYLGHKKPVVLEKELTTAIHRR